VLPPDELYGMIQERMSVYSENLVTVIASTVFFLVMLRDYKVTNNKVIHIQTSKIYLASWRRPRRSDGTKIVVMRKHQQETTLCACIPKPPPPKEIRLSRLSRRNILYAAAEKKSG